MSVQRIKELTTLLNQYRDKYYNESISVVSDFEYDKLYDELVSLENETGISFANSPTKTVGYEVVSELKKTKHTHEMLSLNKTKSIDDLIKMYDNKNCILSLKMDGLTICLTYENGKLSKAETRGNGYIGELVTHNAMVFENIPLTINYKKHFEIEGEAIITYDSFEKINGELPIEKKYKNPRNLVSGSVRQLDSSVAAKRNIKFVAWKLPGENYSMSYGLTYAKQLGFTVVPYTFLWSDPINNISHENLYQTFENQINILKNTALNLKYPIDGLVLTYNDIEYGKSLGVTGHHPKHSLAFKFYEDEEETIVRDIEWSIGKTGTLTPVAIFDPVELAGTEVSRASIHNVSILKNLNLSIGDTVTVYKANEIIPQIRENLTNLNQMVAIPHSCPVCGQNTIIEKENDSEVLKCNNPNCKGKLLGRLSHFVSRKGMNIDGLSDETLSKFIDFGLIHNLSDIYELPTHFEKLKNMDGFGERSVDKLINSIEESKHAKLHQFISALSIPGIGVSQSKELCKHFITWEDFEYAGFNNYDFSNIPGFGKTYDLNIHKWFSTMYRNDKVYKIIRLLTFDSNEKQNESSDKFNGKVFVITGSLNKFSNRNELKDTLELLGAKVSGSISSKTTFLINNDVNSTSSKNKKAKQLNIPIITEDDVIKMMHA